ncbi:hypothetical protein AVEN_68248-1 [Araneus ventricosus]|uniref:Uncharacterized protein n=1 Tax=Araneus ventricosus TaxID=182803 RepID=A0A4Y2XB36_ARAVE|nr:hypothetical protein AVEN_52808-1 [Araneus ventricosus]GBO46380.1 hypothetical protein AVEN_68248-1 [Araneus ventricosus]
MLSHSGGGGDPGWNGRCTSGVLSPGRVTQGVKAVPLYPAKSTKAMDKIILLPSGVQGLVPTEAAPFSFTMNLSSIVLDTASSDFQWASGLLDLV